MMFIAYIFANIFLCYPWNASSFSLSATSGSRLTQTLFRVPAFPQSNFIIQNKSKHLRSNLCLQAESSDTSCESPTDFYVRKARYMELGHVVNIIIDGFYNPSAFVRPYLYLSELSRLQGNFPYDNDVHSFLVACTMVDKQERIIGFVDVDRRDGKKMSDAPRPYLSDLAVHVEYRRIGVAKALVRNCEIESMNWGKDYLYLRVDKSNDAALKMYQGLSYEKEEHSYFGKGRDTTILLKHVFNCKEADTEKENESVDSKESLNYVI